jgi:nucleolar protein 56
MNEISEGLLPDLLQSVLELNLPQTSGKKSKVVLGVHDKKLAAEISSNFPGVLCETGDTSEVVHDLLRGLRTHSEKLLKGLQEGDVGRAQLGLGHAYSRAKVKFNVHKNDNHIIQQIATLDMLDKHINSNAMRVREWYGWHFPELIRIESDNVKYAKLASLIGNKSKLSDDNLHEIAAVLDEDGDKARAIINAAKISMGQDITSADIDMVRTFSDNVVRSALYRRLLANSLDEKMSEVAPNLQCLLGTAVAARLISHAGSLTNLAKYPASTLQILGAEKALFRALKTKGNTPKYGLIFQSSFIGRAKTNHKGRISRYLANKCSLAARIDNFSEHPTPHFGEAMRKQLEERLEFYATGVKPMKNKDAMNGAIERILADGGDLDVDHEMLDAHEGEDLVNDKLKSKRGQLDEDAMDVDEEAEGKPAKKKKSKKSKSLENGDQAVNGEKKSKKHKKKKEVES